MKNKIKISFSKFEIDSQKHKDFFEKTNFHWISKNDKKVSREIYLILQPRKESNYILISSIIEYPNVLELFKSASVITPRGRIVEKNKYHDKFLFEGIIDIDNYNIFVIENFNENFFRTNALIKKVLMQENKKWFAIWGAKMRAISPGYNYCDLFIDRKNKQQMKNFFFSKKWRNFWRNVHHQMT